MHLQLSSFHLMALHYDKTRQLLMHGFDP